MPAVHRPPSRSPKLDPDTHIEPYAADSPLLDAAARLYVETYGKGQDWAQAFFGKYARLPDFRGAVAVRSGQVIGYAFGAAADPGNWWYDCVARVVGRYRPEMQDAWSLVEIAVLEGHRRHGIGSALHSAVVDVHPRAVALLSTEVDNTTARRFYEARGWRYVVDRMAFPDDPAPYVIMCR